MGSERGDGYKKPSSLGEGTGTKVPDNSEAPQRATASRLVPTHQADPPFPEGDKRRFGYSRDHRPDCVQIVIAPPSARAGSGGDARRPAAGL